MAYTKPEFKLTDLAEGVYMASGAVSSNAPYKLNIRYIGERQWGNNYNQYDIIITNTGSEAAKNLYTEVAIEGTINSVTGNGGATLTIAGNKLQVTATNWGNPVEAGGTVAVYVQTNGEGNLK